MADPVRLTHHAVERWGRRFKGHVLQEAYARSEELPFRRLFQWKVATPKRTGDLFRYDPQTGAIFVMRPEERGGWLILTVIRRNQHVKRG